MVNAYNHKRRNDGCGWHPWPFFPQVCCPRCIAYYDDVVTFDTKRLLQEIVLRTYISRFTAAQEHNQRSGWDLLLENMEGHRAQWNSTVQSPPFGWVPPNPQI
jgi:hypothetical protein